MPPKQTSEQIDVRLDELEAFIKSNAASIATVDADSMLAVVSRRRKQFPEAVCANLVCDVSHGI